MIPEHCAVKRNVGKTQKTQKNAVFTGKMENKDVNFLGDPMVYGNERHVFRFISYTFNFSDATEPTTARQPCGTSAALHLSVSSKTLR
jgi:hypothetical protein